jgi:hypothetical protein
MHDEKGKRDFRQIENFAHGSEALNMIPFKRYEEK